MDTDYNIAAGIINFNVVRSLSEVRNKPPVAVGIYERCEPGESLEIDAEPWVYDPEEQALKVAETGEPEHGTVTLIDDVLKLLYEPDEGYTGSDRFTYTVEDEEGLQSKGYINVLVEANHPPVAMPDFTFIILGSEVSVTPLENDSDPDPYDKISLKNMTWESSDGYAAVQIDPDRGMIEISTDLNCEGIFTVPYTITDKQGAEDTGPIFVESRVVPLRGNQPPCALPDHYTLQAGERTGVSPLSNDMDFDGDPIHLTAVNNYSFGGEVILGEYGSVWYTAGPEFTGTAYVVYSIQDSHGASAISVMHFHVTASGGSAAGEFETGTMPLALNIFTACKPGEFAEIGLKKVVGDDYVSVINAAWLEHYEEFEQNVLGQNALRQVDSDYLLQFFAPQYGTLRLGNLELAAEPDKEITDLRRDSLSAYIGDDTVNIKYTPPADFRGRDQFVYRFEAGAGKAAMGVINIDVEDEAVKIRDWMMY